MWNFEVQRSLNPHPGDRVADRDSIEIHGLSIRISTKPSLFENRHSGV